MASVTPSTPPQRRLRTAHKASRDQTRAQNRRLVLQHIAGSGDTSRADIARSTGLTPPTVSNIVAEMLDEGLVEALGKADDAQVGKPRQLVALAAGHYQVGAIDLSGPAFRGAVYDLAGSVGAEHIAPGTDLRGDAALAAALDLAASLTGQMTADERRVVVATPGVVDDAGTVHRAAYFDWTDVDLAGLIEDRCSVATHVVNDGHALALAEFAALTDPVDNLVAVRVARGLSAGIILHGALFRGDGFAAGEIGFLLPSATPGTDESVINVHRLAAALGAEGDLPAAVATTDADRVAEVGDELGTNLGRALAAVVGVLDVHTVRIDPAVSCLGHHVLDAARRELGRSVVAHIADRVDLRFGAGGPDAVRSGAVRAVTHHDLGLA